MGKLENFYKIRSECPYFFSEEEWKVKEIEAIQECVTPLMKQTLNDLLKDAKCPLSINVTYDGNQVVDVTVERQADEKPEEEDEDEPSPIHRGPSVGFAVYFPDGTVVQRTKAKDTFVATLQVVGLNRVAGFRGKTFSGFPLVSKTFRKNGKHKYQEKAGGWFVYTHMSNKTKKEVLLQLSSEMDLGLVIKDVKDGETTEVPSSRVQGKRQMYYVDGEGPFNKRTCVFETIRKYMELHPDATERELQQAFPADVQGGLGVVRNMTWVQSQVPFRKDISTRFFVKPEELIMLPDGEQLAVCNQWGNNFDGFIRVAREVGILIEKCD